MERSVKTVSVGATVVQIPKENFAMHPYLFVVMFICSLIGIFFNDLSAFFVMASSILTLKALHTFYPYGREHNYELKFHTGGNYKIEFLLYIISKMWKDQRKDDYHCDCEMLDAMLRTYGFKMVSETERRQKWEFDFDAEGEHAEELKEKMLERLNNES